MEAPLTDELLQRLRGLLAPRYDVEREIGRGGMGIVYAGRHVLLDQRVAVKVLRRGLESAVGIERFLREPRMLAKLSHPNIVHVHDTSDDASEVLYYIMEFLEGETLEVRLARGRLAPREAAAIGRDVLAGLQFAHERGIIHRDVKPSNIFLVRGRAVLTDFGVAKSLSDAGLTATDQRPGTIPYMPPELLAQGEATPQTDIYSLAMVLYEAATGRQWDISMAPEEAEHAGLPVWFASALRRALAWAPRERWPDAASFAHALEAPRRRIPPTVWAGASATTLVLAWIFRCSLLGWCPAPSQRLVRVEIQEAGRGGAPSALADSLSCAVADELSAYPDVRGECSRRRIRWRGGPTTVFDGSVTPRGDSLGVDLRSRVASIPSINVGRAREEWVELVRYVANEIYARILVDPLEPLLPRAVLPKNPVGLRTFVEAERLLKEARWSEAYQWYTRAAEADSTCWMCYLRRAEVGQWFGLARDSADVGRYEAHRDAFPEYYRGLIRAQAVQIPARLDSLDRVTRRWREFLIGQFRYADELMHRGPLVGRARREARTPFAEAARLKPEFAPAWEHLTWLWIAEGDSAFAREALDRFKRVAPRTEQVSAGLQALFEIAFAWRFLGEAEALEITDRAAVMAEAAGAPVDAGARFLVSFDTPRGALALARLLEARPALERSALIAQVVARLVLGQPDSARLVARELRDRFPETRLALFIEELDAALHLTNAPGGATQRPWAEIEQALSQHTLLHAGSADLRRRAAWMLALHATRRGDTVAARRYRGQLADEPAPRLLSQLLQAAALAGAGRYDQAVMASDTLTTVLAPALPDPFLRAVLHLLRAEWYERLGRHEDARRELLWHENEDRVGLPVDDPQPEEVDWAFGVEARWRRVQLLERTDGSRDERCALYSAVARLWARGDSSYAARAALARARREQLGCATTR